MIVFAQVDLKSMSDDELLLLSHELVTELFNRGKKASIPVGEYLIGEHIPAGEYHVELNGMKGFNMSMISTYSSINESSLDGMYSLADGSSEIGRLVLHEGGKLVVSIGGIYLRALTSLTFVFE